MKTFTRHTNPALPVALLCLLISSCQDIRDHSPQKEEALYLDYRITGEENYENVTCVFQFREDGDEGETITLPPGASISLDGKVLKPDSAGLSGIYYEARLPLAQFSGKHEIVFRNENGKSFKEQFRFRTFSIPELPETISRSELEIPVEGLGEGEVRVGLVMIDTAFANNDVQRKATVVNGILRITEDMLGDLVNGPISLQVYREEARGLKEGWGMLVVRYGVRRDFVLE
jgi:hypothetical protein